MTAPPHRVRARPPRRLGAVALSVLLGASAITATSIATTSCGRQLRSAVDLKLKRHPKTPHTASVYIDEEFIGTLGWVGPQVVRLPEGEHRITVTKAGYFPWDRLVVSDRKPITLDVQLVKIPD